MPAQDFGCEQCGGHDADLDIRELAGTGTVLEAVLITRHPNPQVATPLTLGRIQLTEGPVVYGALSHGDDAPSSGWSGVHVFARDDDSGAGPSQVFVPVSRGANA